MFSQCKHKWDKVSDIVTESSFEMALRVGKEHCVGSINLPHQLVQDGRKHIVILTCSKCGKVKEIVNRL